MKIDSDKFQEPAVQVTALRLAQAFLRLGATAFGGPAAHIAMMRTEFVERAGWLAEAEFLDMVGSANVLPGPSSTEVAIMIGLRLAGWLGLLVAGVCFILPAALIVTAIAWAYVRYGRLPQFGAAMHGISPVIIAVIGQALWMLGRTALRSRVLQILAAAAFALAFLPVPPIAILFGAGALAASVWWMRSSEKQSARPIAGVAVLAASLLTLPLVFSALAAAVGRKASAIGVLAVFAQIGSVVYGSGFVLLAFLRTDLVDHLHLISTRQLLDAVAVGQFTPGPVFTTATFIGYLVAGPVGAAAATIGIFLPAFLFVALAGPMIARARQSPLVGAFLDGVNAAAVALMASVTITLGKGALVDISSVAICAASAYCLIKLKVNSAWLVVAGAVIGLVIAGHW